MRWIFAPITFFTANNFQKLQITILHIWWDIQSFAFISRLFLSLIQLNFTFHWFLWRLHLEYLFRFGIEIFRVVGRKLIEWRWSEFGCMKSLMNLPHGFQCGAKLSSFQRWNLFMEHFLINFSLMNELWHTCILKSLKESRNFLDREILFFLITFN